MQWVDLKWGSFSNGPGSEWGKLKNSTGYHTGIKLSKLKMVLEKWMTHFSMIFVKQRILIRNIMKGSGNFYRHSIMEYPMKGGGNTSILVRPQKSANTQFCINISLKYLWYRRPWHKLTLYMAIMHVRALLSLNVHCPLVYVYCWYNLSSSIF